MADLFAPIRFGEDGPTAGEMRSVSGLVVHHTGGHGSVGGVVTTLKDRTSKGKLVGATYVMERDGTVYRIVPEGARTNHATGYNSTYEGIEVIANNDGDVTPQQIAAFQKFAEWHSATYGYTLSPSTVWGHGEISANKRETEGATLKWTLLQAEGYKVPPTVMVGDLGDGTPATPFSEAPPWVRRPPADIPTQVASELDVRPPATADALATSRARVKLLDSAAMYGVRVSKPGDPPIEFPEMTPSEDYGVVRPTRSLTTLSEMGFLAPRETFDPVGDGPASWFATPDVAADGLGGVALMAAGAGIRPSSMTDTGDEITWREFTRQANVPLPAPAPLKPPAAAPAAPRQRPDGSPLYDGIIKPGGGTYEPGPPVVFPKASDRLANVIATGYEVGRSISTGDDLEDNPDTAGVHRQTVLPAVVPGRWAIDPESIARQPALVAPKLTTDVAFGEPDHPMPLVAVGRYAAMAASFDHFTMPAAVAPTKPPAGGLEFRLIGSQSWNDAMVRRDQWIESRPTKPVAAPSVAETRAEQAKARTVAAQTSTSTVKTPTKVAAPAAPAPKPLSVAATTVGRQVAIAPSVKPKTVQVLNPAWVEWDKLHGSSAPGPTPQAVDKLNALHDKNDDRIVAASAPRAAPAVPPAPPRYISKPVTPAATRPAPSKSALTGGLYVVGAGDTLSAISRRSGVSVAELARINGIADPNKIQAGQKIRLSASNNGIPVAAPAPASTKAAAKAGADQPSSTANSGTTFTGSSTGRTYVVGQVYVNSQGVQKMAMADGTFKAI